MSRRFGRNQKRRMRAELAQTQQRAAEYESAWNRECELLRDAIAKRDVALESLRYMVEQIQAIAPASCILPPGELLELKVNDASLQAVVRIDLHDPTPRVPIARGDVICGRNEVARTIHLHKLVHAVERNLDAFQYLATVKVGDERQACYAISDKVFREKRMHPAMLRELCVDVGRRLYQQIGFKS